MPEVDINYLAVLVAAIASMIVGAIWYSPMVMGKQWMALTGKTEEEIKKMPKNKMTKMYLLTFIGSLVMAYVLAHMIDYVNADTATGGLQTGFWLWLGFVAPAFLSEHLFNGKPMKLYGIVTGFQLVNLLVMGVIIALWQ